jgi:hypothetical protein
VLQLLAEGLAHPLLMSLLLLLLLLVLVLGVVPV